MPLARIISDSHQCCQELAMDLLARGYAVEIVSPDKIPNNFADLELRVDTDAANDLTAKVAARAGEHSSSLDFVHHLNAPMGNFVRRPPKAKFESIAHLTAGSFNAEPGLDPDIEMPAENQEPTALPIPDKPEVESPRIISAGEAPTPSLALRSLPDAEHVPPLNAAMEQVPPTQTRPRTKRGITIIVHRSGPPKIRLKMMKETQGWFWRAAASFGLIVALSAIPILGIRGGDPLVPSAEADAQEAIPKALHPATAEAIGPASEIHRPTPELSSSPVLSTNHTSPRVPSVGSSSGTIKDLVPYAALIHRDKPVAKTVSHRRRGKIRQREDDIVARDTVKYLGRESSSESH